MRSLSPDSPLCGRNLQSHGQNGRLRMGLLGLGVGLGLAMFLVQADIPRSWRLILFIPFFIAAFGSLQGLYRTCPGMAMKGVRETASGGEVRVIGPEDQARMKKLGNKVMATTAGVALAATMVIFLLP